MKYLFSFLLLILLNCGFLYSQNPEWVNFKAFYATDIADDGENIWISGKEIIKYNKTTNEVEILEDVTKSFTQKVFVDNKNNICISSSGTLFKYNHVQWTSYTTDNSSIPKGNITSFALDSNRNTWFSTNNQIVKIIEDTFETYNFEIYNMDNYNLYGNINRILFDNANNLWLCIDYGFAKFDFDTIINYNLDWTDDVVFDLEIIDSNNILVAAGRGLFKFNNGKYETINEDVTCTDIGKDVDGSYWIASYTGLYRYDGANIMKYTSSNPKIFQKPITKLILDNNIKWMIINNKLVKYDNTDWNIIEFSGYKLLDNTIGDLKKDMDGFYWISSINGFSLMKNDNWVYNKYFDNPILLEYVNSVSLDNDGNIWLGCNDKFVKITKTNTISYSFSPTGEIGTYYKTYFSKVDGLWVEQYVQPDEFSSYLYGFYKFNGTDWVDSKNYNGITLKGIIEDNLGNLWFNTGNDIERFDGEKWIGLNFNKNSVDLDRVKKIAFNKDSIWVATSSYGLYLFDGTLWKNFTNVNFGIANPSWPSTSIKDIVVSEGKLWIASFEGLIKFEDNSFKVFDESNSPLMSNYISNLFLDDLGNLWIANNGITIYRDGGVILKTEDITQKLSENSKCYPNPFSESTTIKYYLDKPEYVKLKVYNDLGQEISTLVNSYINEGEHQAKFDAGNFTKGIYYYKLIIGNEVEFGKMILIK